MVCVCGFVFDIDEIEIEHRRGIVVNARETGNGGSSV